jgi:hypothetical protein
VPPYEDWYVTECKASFSTGSSAGNSFIFKSEGGSSGLARYQGQASTVAQTLATINSGTSTSLNNVTTVTASAGEYEGLYVPAGSTVRIVSSASECGEQGQRGGLGFRPVHPVHPFGGLTHVLAW